VPIAIPYTAPTQPAPGEFVSLYDEFEDACSVLVPVDILGTPGAITSITAGGVALAEDTNPAWTNATSYDTGDRVYLASTHRVYESLKDNNVGKDPSLQVNQTTAAGVGTWWLDIGPTNRAAMFDGLVNSQTSAASPLVITLRPGAFNGFALFGVDADEMDVRVRAAPGGQIIYDEVDTPLEGSQPADYYEYFFDRFKPLRQVIRVGLDPYGDSEIVLTLRRATGDVKLGMFAIGDLRPVGIPQRDASVEPQDFSVIKQDAFGNTRVTKRPNATGMSITTVMENEEAGAVLQTIKDVLGVPVVVIGSGKNLFEWLTVFGLISARMSPVPWPYATLNISVKGLI
jgi:hypothetical protein